MTYTEDLHTSDWQKRKHWNKAVEECQGMTAFFQVSKKTTSKEQTE
jgi:hypothetical protein